MQVVRDVIREGVFITRRLPHHRSRCHPLARCCKRCVQPGALVGSSTTEGYGHTTISAKHERHHSTFGNATSQDDAGLLAKRPKIEEQLHITVVFCEPSLTYKLELYLMVFLGLTVKGMTLAEGWVRLMRMSVFLFVTDNCAFASLRASSC